MRTTFLSLALAGGLLFAGQAMATDLLQDDDLDRLSAAGEPTVITSEVTGTGNSTITLVDESIFDLTLPANAQVGLRALTIQNVVGEVQLLVNLNVLSASNSVAGTDQRNYSLQSWGSTLPDADTIKTVSGVSAVANAACSTTGSCAAAAGTANGGAGGAAAAAASAASGGNGGNGGTGGAGGTGGNNLGLGGSGGSNPACTSSCTGGAGGSADGPGGPGGTGGSASGGAGGNAAAAASAASGGNAGSASANAAGNTGIIKGNGAASTSPGVIGGTLGSASGDVILASKANNGNSVVAFDNGPTFNVNLASNAQHDLSALFISNISGRAQLAYNLNIASATLNLIPSSDTPFAQPIGNTTAVIAQSNVGLQFRGTPMPGASGTSSTFNVTVPQH